MNPATEAPATSVPGRNRFTFGTSLFLRLLALVHLIAFSSFWTQLEGLVGPHGLLPATRFFAAVREQIGGAAYWQLPSVCWWFGAEKFLHILCGGGVVLSLLLFFGIAPAICLVLLWVAYLSLNGAGQIFFNFQWDSLLLETTLLAIFVAPWSLLPFRRTHEPPRFARLIVWWLLARLMFLSGLVKLASGDPTWRNLSALTFHYETQPLPTPIGWYVHQLPASFHFASCVLMFTTELAAPFLLFGPRMLRHGAALLLAALMVIVELTGNYTFFNLLAIALCVSCLDDAWWRRVLPSLVRKHFHALREFESESNLHVSRENAKLRPVGTPRGQRVAAAVFAGFVFGFTLLQTIGNPPGFRYVARALAPFRSLNSYGLFAVMTNPRPELIFEGSDDGREWRAYEFPHKPGELTRRPTWVAPHQPRLDWQLWFAALGAPQQNPWVIAVCEHLLRGTPEVLALLASNPFPDEPPRHVRVVRYEYHFTDFATRARTGEWWRRTPMDLYVPPVALR